MTPHKVKVDIEYCSECGLHQEFKNALSALKAGCPNVEVTGHEGRRGSFEIKMNDTLIHSRLASLATPDYEDFCRICRNISVGNPIPSSCKTKNDCQIL
ncbi:migration and invasion enhancer 1 [Coccinella septempunctata]|uniref:migration and invasion enhancer 1 n=1 Tax=Coccinella septempunctata TaxID=41139 RepID=UPI001D094298|nr:migration and invasion enhancer 1 [Coccinella septempunctata]